MIDLHLHLDGSISLQSARELSQMQGIPVPDDGNLRKMMMVGPECRDLNDFLTKFAYPCSLLQTESAIQRSVHNLLSELRDDGLIYAEIRFAPQLLMDKGLEMEQVIEAAIAGLDDSILPANLILCCMRGLQENVVSANRMTIELTAKYLGRGVVAADLAGAEAIYPTTDYTDLFAYARKLDVPFEIHAGEAQGVISGIESMRAAIDFGAARIGHGIAASSSESLLEELVAKNIPLTVCPTSNLCTCAFADIIELPFRKFLNAGVSFCLNTDDMTVEGIDLRHEYALVRSAFGMTLEEEALLVDNAIEMSFASDSLKTRLHGQAAEHYNQGKQF